MFPDPFKKFEQKLDEKFDELIKHMDTLQKSIETLNKNTAELTQAIKDSIKKQK